MKSLVFALLLSVAFCASMTLNLTHKPFVDEYSCDLALGLYYFWLPANRTGFDEDTTFQLPLSKPNVYANCTICADSKTLIHCSYVTCSFNANTSRLKNATIELPEILNTSLLDFDINGWDIYVAPNTIIAVDVVCPTYPIVTITGKPFVNDSSCNTTNYRYYFWIPITSTVIKDVQFEFQMIYPQRSSYYGYGQDAYCRICDSSNPAEECRFITCYLRIREHYSYEFENEIIELPETLSTSRSGFFTNGWDTYIRPNTVVATGVYCPRTNFSGYIKIGAILLVVLFLFK